MVSSSSAVVQLGVDGFYTQGKVRVSKDGFRKMVAESPSVFEFDL